MLRRFSAAAVDSPSGMLLSGQTIVWKWKLHVAQDQEPFIDIGVSWTGREASLQMSWSGRPLTSLDNQRPSIGRVGEMLKVAKAKRFQLGTRELILARFRPDLTPFILTNHLKRILALTQCNESGMPQVVVASPFQELELSD